MGRGTGLGCLRNRSQVLNRPWCRSAGLLAAFRDVGFVCDAVFSFGLQSVPGVGVTHSTNWMITPFGSVTRNSRSPQVLHAVAW